MLLDVVPATQVRALYERVPQVLHLIGMGLVEEQQHLISSTEDNDPNFNFTLKISSMSFFCLLSSHTQTPLIVELIKSLHCRTRRGSCEHSQYLGFIGNPAERSSSGGAQGHDPLDPQGKAHIIKLSLE